MALPPLVDHSLRGQLTDGSGLVTPGIPREGQNSVRGLITSSYRRHGRYQSGKKMVKEKRHRVATDGRYDLMPTKLHDGKMEATYTGNAALDL